jgi:hypothetical protein
MTTEAEVLPLAEPSSAAVATRRPAPVRKATEATTPMTMLSMAVAQGADIDKLSKLMDLQERWEKDQARKAFSAAFAAFKSEAVQIIRTKVITDGPLKGKKHAELGNIIQAVSPALSIHGLSLNWLLSKDEKEWMEVTCILRHADGHFETVSMGGAPDTGPGRNAIQARGSAKTYLERYTATAILGLAPEDEDTDGKPPTRDMPENAFQAHLANIRQAQTLPALQETWKQAMNETKDQDTKKALITAKDIRKDELQKGAAK